jgi:hypothetical protein
MSHSLSFAQTIRNSKKIADQRLVECVSLILVLNAGRTRIQHLYKNGQKSRVSSSVGAENGYSGVHAVLKRMRDKKREKGRRKKRLYSIPKERD